MRILYRVKRVDTSARDYEEADLAEATADFLANGVSMTKIRLYYTLENDPENREFDQSDDADVVRNELIAPLQANIEVSFSKLSHYDEIEVVTP